MISRTTYTCALALVLGGTDASALTLGQCTRVTHPTHGGEDMHRDLGDGRVLWRDSWSNEGTATTYKIADCGAGRLLSFRTAENNMSDGTPFDRTTAALDIVDRHERGARVFATFERMAADLDGTARRVAVGALQSEPCACAVLYADLRGDWNAFQPEG